MKMESESTISDIKDYKSPPPYIYTTFNMDTPRENHQLVDDDNNTTEVLDLSKPNRLLGKRKSPSPTNSTSSFATSLSSILYIHSSDGPTPSSTSPYKDATQLICSPNPFSAPTDMIPSPGALFAMYCRSIRESRLPHVPHIRDFIETVLDPCIHSDQIDKLVDQIRSTYSLPPSSLPDQRSARPFKGLPRDPDQIPARFAACDLLKPNPFQQVEGFMEYRKQALERIRSSNGGFRTMTNPKMRRTTIGICSSGQDDNRSNNGDRFLEHQQQQQRDNDASSTGSLENNGVKPEYNDDRNDNNNTCITNQNGVIRDAAYYERRRKNNAAAKKSRDRRRLKEDELTIRNEFLEKQSIELHSKLDTLKLELQTLKSREVQLLCDRKSFETREAELRREFEIKESELLEKLKAIEGRENELLHQNELLKAQNNTMFYRLQALEARGSRLHLQPVH